MSAEEDGQPVSGKRLPGSPGSVAGSEAADGVMVEDRGRRLPVGEVSPGQGDWESRWHGQSQSDSLDGDAVGGLQMGSDAWAPDEQLHERASTEYVGQWNRLVSRTNWEKGKLIVQWRQALEAEGAPPIEYSDEAWSRLVGGVTSQHVGRLRRVYLRFAEELENYTGLYWSHFHAALEWEDAEMWLQGAVDNRWSVSRMRHQRWETLGQLADQRPDPRDVVHGELDEDLELRDGRERRDSAGEYVGGPRPEGPDFGDEGSTGPTLGQRDADRGDLSPSENASGSGTSSAVEDAGPALRPFEAVGDLPDLLTDLLEEFKLAIIRYKTAGWKEVSREQMLAVLDGLRHVVESPSDLHDESSASSESRGAVDPVDGVVDPVADDI